MNKKLSFTNEKRTIHISNFPTIKEVREFEIDVMFVLRYPETSEVFEDYARCQFHIKFMDFEITDWSYVKQYMKGMSVAPSPDDLEDYQLFIMTLRNELSNWHNMELTLPKCSCLSCESCSKCSSSIGWSKPTYTTARQDTAPMPKIFNSKLDLTEW
jgi:hypothetical protein